MREMKYKMKKQQAKIYGNIWYIIKLVYQYKRRILFLLAIFTVLSAITPFLGIYFPKFIIDELINQKRIDQLIMLVIVFFCSSVVLSFITTFLVRRTWADFREFICICSQNYSARCMNIKMEESENPDFLNAAATAQRCMQDTDSGIEGILRKLFLVFGYILSFIGYFSIVFSLNPFLILLLTANVIFPYVTAKAVKKYEYEQRDQISFFSRRLEYLNNVTSNFAYGKEIRLFQLSKWLIKHIRSTYHDQMRIQGKIANHMLISSFLNLVISFLREGIVYLYLIIQVVNHGMSIGDFTMYFSTIFAFSSGLTVLMQELAHIRAQSITISDYRNFMEDSSVEKMDRKQEIPLSEPNKIEFSHVSFYYPGSTVTVIKNLNVTLNSNQKIAIVGPNGAGKTTFVKLLCRLYEPTEGTIQLNGIDIREYEQDEYFKLLSVVFQDVKVFAFSVSENVSLKLKSEEQKVWSCLDFADLKEKMEKMKHGIQTPVLKIMAEGGIELSGGENQRLAIARAAYKEGIINVFDEPTSALDPLAEEKMYQSFHKMMNGKPSVMISHRLSSTRFVDQILVFRQGEVVEEGNHEELIGKQGLYAEMFALQKKYYEG